MSVFAAHFDDSGTHKESGIALASCLVASTEQWQEFNRNWDEVNQSEGFGTFHMADFAFGAAQSKGWSDTKKLRVLRRLCNIILTRARVGWSVAVTKRDYDEIIRGPFRDWCGQFHYTCVRQCAGSIGVWRKENAPNSSLTHIFDRMSQGKGDLMFAMDCAVRNSKSECESTGVKTLGGYSFDSKGDIWPLQAADLFAWTALQQMRKGISGGKRTNRWAELAYELLRSPRSPLNWHYYVGENLKRWALAESNALTERIGQLQKAPA